MVFRYVGIKTFTYSHKNIGIFGPFGPMVDQNNDANKLPRWFFRYIGTNLLLPPVRLGVLVRKGQIWSKICSFGHFGLNIGIFGPFRPMSDQKTMRTRCLGVFSVMWLPKLLLSPMRIRIFAQEQPNLARKWHFWSFWARPCCLIWYPVGGLVGDCGARAVSCKTPIYFIIMCPFVKFITYDIRWIM